MKKLLLLVSILLVSLVLYSGQTAEAAIDLPVRTITGTSFQDLNNNGVYDRLQMEIPLKEVKVSLYKTLNEAQNESKPVAVQTTTSLGSYTFTKLKKGTYYIRYQSLREDYKVSAIEKSIFDGSGIITVRLTDKEMVFTQDLPLNKQTNINVFPFSDHNQNGIKDEGEELIDGKTMIILELKKFKKALQSNSLETIDVNRVISSALKDGNVDLTDGIYLRTSANQQGIIMPNVDNGVYVVIRSPFNLTLKDSLENTDRIKAIIEMLSGGDIQSVLNNATLLNSGDINTNNDNTYLQSLFTIFPKIYDEANKINYEKVLGEDHAKTVTDTLGYLNKTNTLLAENMPVFRLAVVDYYGNAYDFTGLKVKKTNDLFFGIKEYGSIKGSVFADNTGEGKKGKLDLAGSNSRVIVYNEAGEELASTKTTTIAQGYNLQKLPYDTPLFLAIETDKPYYPMVEKATLPVQLQDKKIVGSYYIDSKAAETMINQNIGVLAKNSEAISASIKSIDEEQQFAKVSFKNTDKINDTTVTYVLNDQVVETFVLKKAPLIGSSKAIEKSMNYTRPLNQNELQVLWKKGVYTIELTPLIF
ncbi:SdrD B-like domain-containing protein [Enterococcus sp. LJL99]